MPELIVPAPLWRRLIASVYDGLLLLGIWMAAALFEFLLREQLLGLPRNAIWAQLYFFGVGLAFFGWFWTHGGQTLGMRVWRLRVRRLDAGALRWPIAALRYAAMLATWMAALAPLALELPGYAGNPHRLAVVTVCALFALAAAAMVQFGAQRRAPCDWLAGTEVVELPRAAAG